MAGRKKRYWTDEEKCEICAQARLPDASVAQVARHYAVNANMVFKWLKDPRYVAGVQGACLFSKRLEKGRFVWPASREGKVSISASQLTMLLEGIDWRIVQTTWRPLMVG